MLGEEYSAMEGLCQSKDLDPLGVHSKDLTHGGTMSEQRLRPMEGLCQGTDLDPRRDYVRVET